MGFKDFIDMNLTLLAKQAWRAFKNPQALWVRILKAEYFPGVDLVESRRWTIGNGNNIGISNQRWMVNREKAIPRDGQNLDVVSDIMNESCTSWDYGRVREAFNQ